MDSLHRCMSSTVIKNRTMTSITLALRLSLLLWCEFFMQKEMTHISSAVLLVCACKSTSVVFAMNLSDIQTSLMYHREKGRRRKQQLWASLVVLKNNLTVPYTSSQHSCFVRDRPAQKPFLSLMFGAIASAWNSAWYFISALIRIFSFDRCWNLSIDKYFGWRIEEDGWTEEDGWRTEDDDHVCSLGSPSLLFFIVSVVIIIGLVLTIFTMLGRSAHILQMEWERETETDRQREAETDRQTES